MFGLSIAGTFLYFLLFISLISISMYVSRTREITVESYFFANRNKHWVVLGISFLTSTLFSPYIFGLNSLGVASGFPMMYGIISAIMLIILGWFLAPIYLQTKINTLPEYFEKRFNKTCKYFLSSLYIFYNIFIRLMIILVAGSIYISKITGGDAYSSLLFFLIITGIYIVVGGLQAEIYVNIIQVFFITLSAVGFLGWVVYQGDGINLIVSNFSSLFTLGVNSDFSMVGILIGLPIIGFWFWCTDQFMVQKVLSSRNIHSIRKATILSVFLQIIPIIVFILPGFMMIYFFHGTASDESLNTLFYGGILPDSLRGGLIIGVAAILTASFASVFNSTSILITFDFYRSFRPASSERKLVLVGRLTAMILLFISIVLIPVAQNMNFNSCLKMFKTFSYFSALISAVFIISLVNNKIKAATAVTTLISGTIIIILRIIGEIVFNNDYLGNNIFSWFVKSNFLEFSTFIFVLSILFLFCINKLESVQHLVFYLKKL